MWSKGQRTEEQADYVDEKRVESQSLSEKKALMARRWLVVDKYYVLFSLHIPFYTFN